MQNAMWCVGSGRQAAALRSLVDGLYERGQRETEGLLRLRDVEVPLENHLLRLGSDIGFFTDLGDDRVQDVFGVVWDRSSTRTSATSRAASCPGRPLAGYRFPDPLDPRSSPTSRPRSPAFPTAFACSRSAFRFTSGPGRCGAWND